MLKRTGRYPEALKNFQKALAKAKLERRGHAPLEIESDGLHIEMAGGFRALSGRVWLLKEIPAGVDSNEIH